MAALTVAHVTTVDMSLRYLLLNQLRYLQGQGYRVIGVSSPGPDVAAVEAAGIKHIAVPMTRRLSPLKDLAAVQELTRVFRRERVDIVHTHTPKPGLLGQLAARLAGVPVVVNTIHGFYFHDGMKPWPRRFFIMMEQVAAAQSDWILSQNPEDIETAKAEHIAPADILEPLGNGIDLERFDGVVDRADRDEARDEVRAAARAECGFVDGDVVVGFVGRLVREKGLVELFDAVKALRTKNASIKLLVVGGTDPEKPDAVTADLARQMGLGPDVAVFLGQRHDLPRLYAAMDIFVLPSHREGFPRAPMEAAATGLPVVVTNIRGCRETVVVGETGVMVDVDDAAGIAAAVAAYADDGDLRKRHGRAGRALAEARFDERLVFARVAACYERVRRQGGRRRGTR